VEVAFPLEGTATGTRVADALALRDGVLADVTRGFGAFELRQRGRTTRKGVIRIAGSSHLGLLNLRYGAALYQAFIFIQKNWAALVLK
jgi:hypothetical protein